MSTNRLRPQHSLTAPRARSRAAAKKSRELFAPTRTTVPPMEVAAVNRRDACCLGLAATAAFLYLGVHPSRAKASPLLFALAKGVFVVAVSEFVKIVLGRVLPTDEDVLKIEYVHRPRPTEEEDEFHARFAERYTITNTAYHFDSTRSDRFGYYTSLASFARSDDKRRIAEHKDLSGFEISIILRERRYYDGVPLFPCGKRMPFTKDLREVFHRTCAAYSGLDPLRLSVDYVRPLNDGSDSYLAFACHNARNEPDLLIEPKVARIAT